ncbi:MAG: helix-turn-helix domain-containing protein [Bdellovibrionia bacterium]
MTSRENNQKKPGESLGQIVRNARKSKNLTQSECASRCGLGRRHFQKIEAGEVNPPLMFFKTISGVLETRACYLLNEEALNSRLSEHGISCESEILNHMPTPVFVANLKGELIFRNASFIQLFGAGRTVLNELFSNESEKKNIQTQVLSNTAKSLPQASAQYHLLAQDQSDYLAQISWKRLARSASHEASAVLGVVAPAFSPNPASGT